MKHKMKQKTSKLCIVVLCVVMLLALAGCNSVDTVIENANFEQGENLRVEKWEKWDYNATQGDTDTTVIRIESGGVSGNCVMIQSNETNDARIYQSIDVEKKGIYKVTAMVRIDGTIDEGLADDERGAGLNISAILAAYRSASLYTTNGEWQEMTAYIQAGDKQKTVDLSIGIGGYSATSSGTVYIDDVTIEQVKSLPDGEAAVNVAVTETKSDENTDAPLAFKLLFAALAVAVIALVIVVVRKSDEERYKRKIPLSDERPRLSKRDGIVMLIMTVICATVSLVQVGDTTAASNYWSPDKAGEYVTVEFDTERTVSRITYSANRITSSAAVYVVEYEDAEADGGYTEVARFKAKDEAAFFEWTIKSPSFTAKRVRITAAIKGMGVNEVAFFYTNELGEYELIPVTVVENSYDESTREDEFTPDKLFDEQEYAQAYKTLANSTYFDEVYFPRTAYEQLNGLPIYETTHPPLGKVIISIGIAVFGMNPFGWRIMGILFGIAIVPLMYLLAFKLFGGNSRYAFIAAFLMMFDFMRTTQTRLPTIDTYSVFFVILMYYFMYDYFSKRSYEMPLWKSWIPLLLSGICFGLGAASKWTSIYAGVGLAVLFFVTKISEANDIAKGRYQIQEGKRSWLVGNFLPTCLMCVLFFIVIPGTIYVLSYIPYMASNPDKTLIEIVLDNQEYMYTYHSKLVVASEHAYSSPWYSWIIDLKPLYYYSSSSAGLEAGMRASVAAMGNPLVWWTGLACIAPAVYYTWKRRSKAMLVAFIGYGCQLFPWILVTRTTFIYHYFTAIPFLILMIVFVIKCMLEDKVIGKPTVFIYLGLVLALYCLFYPVLVGLEVPSEYISNLRWFGSWVF